LVAEARAALARDDADAAEASFDQALALWRVAPLADFRFAAFAQAESRRLEELHDAAVADRVDARIARGRAQLVVAELEALIASSPLWERPRAQLMRALYLTGRQANALELYRRSRTLLDEELGVEPGPELQKLERQILNQDPELGEPVVPLSPKGRRRRLRLLVALTCLLAALAVFAFAFLFTSGAPARLRPNITNPSQAVSVIDPSTNRVVSTTGVGRYPQRIVADRNAVWVLNFQDGTISRLDPRTRLVVHTFAPGAIPTALAVFADALWVATPLANRVLRLDESTDAVTARFRAPNPLWLAPGRRVLWVVGKTVSILDPATGRQRVLADLQVKGIRPNADANPGSVSALGRRLFFDGAGAHLMRVDQTTGTRRQAKISRLPETSRMVAADGSLWVTSFRQNQLLKVDPATLKVTRKITVGTGPVGVTAGAGSLWVANSGEGTVTRIDPADGRILATIRIGGTPFDITFAHGLVWTTML
jgi:YVTN family beta-propeller protein